MNEYGVLKYVKFVHQAEALGTGHAIQCCREHIKDLNSKVLILSGDVPLIKENTLLQMVNKLDKARIMTTILEEPYGYGRIIETNGIFSKIVEQKDANEEELKCQKVNAGIYAFDSNVLYKYLPYLSNEEFGGNDFIIESNEKIRQKTKVESVTRGDVDNLLILDGGLGYKVGDLVNFDDTNTDGSGLSAEVDEIVGLGVSRIDTTLQRFENLVFEWKSGSEVVANYLPFAELNDKSSIDVSGLSTSIVNLSGSFTVGISTDTIGLAKTMSVGNVNGKIEDI